MWRLRYLHRIVDPHDIRGDTSFGYLYGTELEISNPILYGCERSDGAGSWSSDVWGHARPATS